MLITTFQVKQLDVRSYLWYKVALRTLWPLPARVGT